MVLAQLAPVTKTETLCQLIFLRHDWAPFDSRSSFELAELIFEKAEMSVAEANHLLRIWAAREVEKGNIQDAPFTSYEDLLNTINDIGLGDCPWESFNVKYSGFVDESSSSWKRCTYTIHMRNTYKIFKSMLSNSDFRDHFDYKPYEEYIGPRRRRRSNLMSGQWAWNQAVRITIWSHI